MMKLRFLWLIVLIPTLACSEYPVGNPQVPEPVQGVDLHRYLGTWYELGRYENRFEKGCEAVTATYGLNDDGTISVANRCHKGTVHGPIEEANGKAKPVEGTNNAKLKVSFFGPFYLGDYWVLDHAPDYSWSIVGEPSGKYLWLLHRSPAPGANAKAQLWKRAATLGYDMTLVRDVAHESAKGNK